MSPARPYPRPLPEIVGVLLARGGALPPAAVTAERLAGWRNDPDITAHLAALTSLDLGEDIMFEERSVRKLLRQLTREEWLAELAENNLARLLEYTPGLKTLALSTVPRKGSSIYLPRYGLNPAHPSLPVHAQTADGMESM